ncbi:hypothetical protein [Jeotgalibaca porci]|uniref:hypothetical protein n=1 Tax=Jeotgalibaca porci TaxID=1868793 RepID=UPI0035A136FC
MIRVRKDNDLLIFEIRDTYFLNDNETAVEMSKEVMKEMKKRDVRIILENTNHVCLKKMSFKEKLKQSLALLKKIWR